MPVPSPVKRVRVTKGGVLPGKRLLTRADLQYLGMYRLPTSGHDMSFSYGQMTGRVVNGETRLIMSGNRTKGDPVYEFIVPATAPGSSIGTAPKMPLFKAWGDIYHGHRVTWNTNGTPRDISASRFAGGMHWSESNQLLYWTYEDTYNVTHIPDWSLGASRLNADGTSVGYGPWRVVGANGAGGTMYGPWRCTKVAESPTGAMLTGATLASGNSKSPWGLDLWDGAFPNALTPAGWGNPDLPLTKDLTYYHPGGVIQPDGTYKGTLRSSRRPGDYLSENSMQNAERTQIDPLKYGGVGSWSQVDTWGGVTWIDLSDRHGVLFTGHLGADHIWYCNAGVGNLLCTHGVGAPMVNTGPVCTRAYPAMWIYDPAELAAVRSGAKVDYTVTAADTIDAEATYGLITAPIKEANAGKNIVGQFFDAATRRLYICAPAADNVTVFGLLLPIVHVFQVN